MAGTKRVSRIDALLDKLVAMGIDSPEAAVPVILSEMADHPRRSPKVEAFLASMFEPERRRKSPVVVPFYALDSELHTLKVRCYQPSGDISVSARRKNGSFVASIVVPLPSRFGYQEDWQEWRRMVRKWIRSVGAFYGDVLIEDNC